VAHDEEEERTVLPMPPTLEKSREAPSANGRSTSVWGPVLGLMVLAFALVIVGAIVLSGAGEADDTPGTPVPAVEEAPPDGIE
jgi:hypothetical protein